MSINVAIDGPSGAGKSSLSRLAAEKVGFIYVDTGALYRTIGLYFYRNDLEVNEKNAEENLSKISIDIKFVNCEQRVFLNGEDVSDAIRVHSISEYASKVGAVPEVRSFLLDTQRTLASQYNVIMDGRDIGSVVLPDADIKIYLTASPEERAKRRHKELIERGQSVDYETVLHDVIERDERDMNREIAPLKIAEGAVILDTTELDRKQSLDALIKIIEERIK